ncbi:hypothetical protein RE628_11245 [Paenibacillus sp. D2_2]|nr:hypothetical protein [Paenibacillus sp. D2_2]WMT42802.1 hypothetical protein RE628_11245 [Paenibacillus sp. D2_2]
MGKYQGGRNDGKQFYVRVGSIWMEINALIEYEKEAAHYRKDVSL